MANNWRLIWYEVICSLHLFSGTFPLVIIILCWFLVLIQYNTEVLYVFFPPYTFGSLSRVTRAVLCDRSIAHDINLARYLQHMTATLRHLLIAHHSYTLRDRRIHHSLINTLARSAGAGAYCGGHLAAQLVGVCISRRFEYQFAPNLHAVF